MRRMGAFLRRLAGPRLAIASACFASYAGWPASESASCRMRLTPLCLIAARAAPPSESEGLPLVLSPSSSRLAGLHPPARTSVEREDKQCTSISATNVLQE